ncbi:MAG: 1-deoxy-D-xylulose-5-phosphate reductoisomerase [Alphaproteobacteria bacterium]|nr:1-deoxy-D-xylulose-5-phosphate reductoisomerase [Alphaproteobacteria bacterium]
MTINDSIKLPQSENKQRTVSILGSTGSIGRSTVDLLSSNRDQFKVIALTAQSNIELLAEQARILEPEIIAISDSQRLRELKEALSGSSVEVVSGVRSIIEVAERSADIVVSAIVGSAGLRPTLSAIRQGKIVALANKECLVCAGDVVMDEVQKSKTVLLPIDSEHNAIFQILAEKNYSEVERVILTASGGPFLGWTVNEMAKATPNQAMLHPNWDMGQKISIDSATLMNKGLELIEAAYFFPISHEKIDIVIHPQSVVHSMVAYIDGSILSQMGAPDMRTPISYTLAWPHRMMAPSERIDFSKLGNLTFEEPNLNKFPSLKLARDALAEGNGSTAVLNASNEIAVENFINKRIGFLDIASIVDATLSKVTGYPIKSLEDFEELDHESRETTHTLVNSWS